MEKSKQKKSEIEYRYHTCFFDYREYPSLWEILSKRIGFYFANKISCTLYMDTLNDAINEARKNGGDFIQGDFYITGEGPVSIYNVKLDLKNKTLSFIAKYKYNEDLTIEEHMTLHERVCLVIHSHNLSYLNNLYKDNFTKKEWENIVRGFNKDVYINGIDIIMFNP